MLSCYFYLHLLLCFYVLINGWWHSLKRLSEKQSVWRYEDIIVSSTVYSDVGSWMAIHWFHSWMYLCLILILTVKSRQCPEDTLLPRLYRKLHSGMKTYGCELCGKRFLDSLRLRMHLLSHSGKNQHLCVCIDICLWMCIYTACIYKNNTVHVEIFHPVFNTVKYTVIPYFNNA